MSSVYDFSALSLTGEPVSLQAFHGKVLLIVNTASACGFTPQYRELETLYRRYQPQGLEVLAFPCNQFRQQEPGEAEEIAAFCEKSFGISFPMFAKIDVNGPHAHPLFRHLKAQAPGLLGTAMVKWNFTKFLVDKNGRVVRRYAPFVSPAAMAADIQNLLGTSASRSA